MQCPSCSKEIPADSRFCLSCGQAVGGFSQMPTVSANAAAAPAASAKRITSDSIPVGGFTPGTILSDRYRIIGLLGRGGMGEVYRADDLKLGQPVALKFLPRDLASDPVRRERFFAEVRITRQLAHPNICRVYDIAEFEGQHFLSMEYIDGEDLASLIKRIGYVSREKALDIARQLAAGLVAAHDRGVLHRDLKPANIMLDGHGRVRITDFGLAIAAGDDAAAAEIFGTPAYMAPEQFEGKGASVRSDIYAFGLILYEIYCGRRVFSATSIAELHEQKAHLTPTAPSEIQPGIDPVVERVILRCIERDPRARPASAAQVAAALPGGDPLAAALAAGETPSPEMVAASGLKEGMRPAVAVALLACIIVGSFAAVLLKQRTDSVERVRPPKPPQALVERAQEFIRKAGYTSASEDRAFGFETDLEVVNHARQSAAGKLADPPESLTMSFWYRESPRPIEGPRFLAVDANTPARYFSGEALVKLDVEGRLRMLRVVPPQVGPAKESSVAPDWAALFSASGLEISTWMPVEPQWNPDSYADTRLAWQGSIPEMPDVPVRIEAAAYRGRPVSFLVLYPWVQPDRMELLPLPLNQKIRNGIGLLTLLCVIAASLFLDNRNLRLGRGDRRGAMRLMLFAQGSLAAVWLLREHHVATFQELLLLFSASGYVLVIGGMLWILYIAFEPFVRRRWPQILVSWTRLLSGEWRDPLLGRDLLAGCAAGVAIVCLLRLVIIVPHWLGYPLGAPFDTNAVALEGISPLVTRIVFAPILLGVISGLGHLLLFVLLRIVLRRDALAVAAFLILRTAPLVFAGVPWISGPIQLTVFGIFLLALMRFGLVAGISAWVLVILFAVPMTFDSSAWYASGGFVALFLVLALSLYAFRVALGGRRLLDIPVD